MPLHCPEASAHWSPFFLHEHVFLSQFPVQLHQTIFRWKAGAAACTILFGFKMVPILVLRRTHPHLVASMLFPKQVCTWWQTLLLWNLASVVGGRRPGGTFFELEATLSECSFQIEVCALLATLQHCQFFVSCCFNCFLAFVRRYEH